MKTLQYFTKQIGLLHFKYGKDNYFSKPILQLDKHTNQVLNEFDSLTIASEKTGINTGNISSVCIGLHKTAGSYKWKYK